MKRQWKIKIKIIKKRVTKPLQPTKRVLNVLKGNVRYRIFFFIHEINRKSNLKCNVHVCLKIKNWEEKG